MRTKVLMGCLKFTQIGVVALIFFISSAISEGALVANWNFESDYTDDVASYDGTGINTPSFNSSGVQESTCLSLDSGSSEYVSVSDSSALRTSNFTISVWAKVASGSSGVYRGVIGKRTSTPSYTGYIIYAESGNSWSFWTGGNGGFQQLDGPTVIEDKWTFVTISFLQTGTSGSDLVGIKKLYIDGELVARADSAYYNPASSAASLLIGSAVTYSFYFDGQIDDVRYYNSVLTDTEVAGLYLTTGTCVAHWDLNNALDDQISSHDGTGVNGPSYDDGVRESAGLSLDSDDSEYVSVSYSSSLNPSDFSVCAWVKASPDIRTNRAIVSSRNAGDTAGYYLMIGSNNRWYFQTANSGTTSSTYGDCIKEDQWCFVAATFEQTGTSGSDLLGTKKLYINGELVKTATGAAYQQITSGTSFLIGARTTSDYYYDGQIDEVRVFNSALGASEIQGIYRLTGSYVANWKLNKGPDDSIGDHDGTEYNTPVYYHAGMIGSPAINLNYDSDEYVRIPHSWELCTSDFTISAWAKANSDSSGYRGVIGKRSSGSPYSGYIIYAESGGDWSFWTGNTTGFEQLDGTAVVPSKWTLLTATFEQSGTSGSNLTGTKKFYIDGQLVATNSSANYNPASSSGYFLIGSSVTSAYHFDGFIDDVRYANYAISADEVEALYDEGFSKTLKFMSYNIHYGIGPDDEYDLSRIVGVIQQSGADIIGLCAVDNYYGSRSEYDYCPQELATALGMYYYFGPAISTTHGNVLLSKYPILSATNHALPNGAYTERACIEAKIEAKGKVFSVVVAEFSYEAEAIRLEQIDAVLDIVNHLDGDVIMLGDLNFTPSSTSAKTIKHAFHDSFDISRSTFSNSASRDHYVLISNGANSPVNFSDYYTTAASAAASDYKPVVAEVVIVP